MRVVLLGVRGSTPAPGADFVRYGGHTSCVAVIPDGADVPVLLLDTGTGIRDLGSLLGGAAFDGSVVLSHLHWDHLQGLPFCREVDRPDARVDMYLPVAPAGDRAGHGAGDGDPGRLAPVEVLARGMSPPHFPIRPDDLLGSWRFLASRPGPVVLDGLAVSVTPISHKGGLTHGVRVEADGVSLAYLPDHAPQLGSAGAERLASGVDLLLHDAQFLASERATAEKYGHATIEDALAFADRCGARRVVLTHHAPTRTDDDLDALAKELADGYGDRYGDSSGADRGIHLARQGDVLEV